MCRQRQTAAVSNSLSGTALNVCSRPRKLSVDDGPTSRRACAPGARGVPPAPAQRRPRPLPTTDDVTDDVRDDWWTCGGRRRSSGAWSPAVSTLSRTMSEHTLDRSTAGRRRYAAATAGSHDQCRDDLLDDCGGLNATDRLESVLSPPRLAPVSGQLSLVCIFTASALSTV